jgi:uncharacterized repeat protein (TIGR03803 family)
MTTNRRSGHAGGRPRISIGVLLAAMAYLTPFAARAQPKYFKTLTTFTGTNGATPLANLVAGPPGILYGTTYYGGNLTSPLCAPNGCGVVFRLTESGGTWTETPLYTFKGGSDGANPAGPIAFDKAKGTLYGTTANGGAGGFGTVFSLTLAGAKTTLYSFAGMGAADGANPFGELALNAGVLYGTTANGGQATGVFTLGCGTVFSLSPPTSGSDWAETVLYRFAGGSTGADPSSGVIVGAPSPLTLYGTTFYGGVTNASCPDGCGTVFSLVLGAGGWVESAQPFNGTNGANPLAGLTMGSGEVLYGATTGGGSGECANCGTVYEVETSAGISEPEVVYSFTGVNGDGATPFGTVLFDSATGVLFGTTVSGGNTSGACAATGGCGTLFMIPPGSVKDYILYSFTGGKDEMNPQAGVVTYKGNLYGTTAPLAGPGSSSTDGTVFTYLCTKNPTCCGKGC